MPPSEIKREAREALKSKWGRAVCIILVYMAISFIVSSLERLAGKGTTLYYIIDIVYIIISIPLSFGLLISFMKLKRGEEVSAVDFFKDGFSRFGKSWGVTLWTLLKLLLPIICLVLVAILMTVLLGVRIFASASFVAVPPQYSILAVISVILYIATLVYIVSRAFLYVLAFNISYDEPELSAKACVLKSEALMKGNRGNYFLLELSFIGWALLCVLTAGIGFLWLAPYIQVSQVCFYERIAKTEPKKVDGTNTIEEEKNEE